MKKKNQHVFIIGSKGIPGQYGGYETFLDKLTEYHQDNKNIKYHIACKDILKDNFIYHNAHCFKIKVPNIGAAQAIFYDVIALKYCCDYIKKNHINNPIIYVLACRIGPFIAHYKKIIHRLGGKLYINPDGHEWMRAKWSLPVRKYWKISEKLMIKHSDLIICDSKNIQKYILNTYKKYEPNTTYISYGAETRKSKLLDNDEKWVQWYTQKQLKPKEYYLVVGRFVPENNYETMIREFMKSKSKKDFALITNVSDNFLNILQRKTNFQKDKRIKFVGTVYDEELLKKIRENAYAYLHGHEVGGTNPSLLEALGSTDLNLLLDVGFNEECAKDGAIYWNKKDGNLAHCIDAVDNLTEDKKVFYSQKAKERIKTQYSWNFIADEYLNVFIKKNID